MKKIFFIFLFIGSFSLKAASIDTIQFITKTSVLNNDRQDDVSGITIKFTLDFNTLKSIIKNDSILELSKFTMNATFSENGTKIKPALGYDKLKSKNGSLMEYRKYSNTDFRDIKPFTQTIFIPYAAFDLAKGAHTINVLIGLNGEDALGNQYKQIVIEKNIPIQILPTHKVTFNIDYIEVNEVMSNGASWDTGLFGSVAPEVTVMIMLSNTIIWFDGVENSNIYARGPKSKNIQFMVSDGDKIRFRIEDSDLIFSDFIGEINIPIDNTKVGKTFILKKQFNAVKDAAVTYKIE